MKLGHPRATYSKSDSQNEKNFLYLQSIFFRRMKAIFSISSIMCMCICLCIYIYICMYVYVYVYKLFDIKRVRLRPISNLSKLERTVMNQFRSSNDISVRLQDKDSRLVILDRQDYIDKVESNSNDGSFDVLPSDPSIIFNEAVKNWGEKWINKGEIAEPLLDCILNSKPRPGTDCGLIKPHKPGNPIRLIQRNNYHQVSCGPSLTGKTSSVPLILTHGTHRNVKSRQVRNSLKIGVTAYVFSTFPYSAMGELVGNGQLWTRAALRRLRSYKVG